MPLCGRSSRRAFLTSALLPLAGAALFGSAGRATAQACGVSTGRGTQSGLSGSNLLGTCAQLPGRAGQLGFLVGANYMGPADRAWEMWQDSRFDAGRIDEDFQRAASIGLHCLRLFLQPTLDRDIRRGAWTRLDQVVNLARKNGLQLIVSLGDYEEYGLGQRAADYRAVATRYARNPSILAYDLKNEPTFRDLLLTRYPGDQPLIQTSALIDTYGEQVSSDDVAARRRAEPHWLPADLPPDRAYIYANALAIADSMKYDSWWWFSLNPQQTALDFLDQPDRIDRWSTLLDLTNEALRLWISTLIDPIRKADPQRPVTLDHNDLILASLPANAALDYISIHQYPPPEAWAPTWVADLVQAYGERHGKPAMLGEFGWATGEVDDYTVGQLEGETIRELKSRGLAGALKWMLNDVEGSEEGKEGSFGLFNPRGRKKINAGVIKDIISGR